MLNRTSYVDLPEYEELLYFTSNLFLPERFQPEDIQHAESQPAR